jgi:SAM-dependent methyltransferase
MSTEKTGQSYSASEVDVPSHRTAVGGLWDEVGRLQFDYLVGCGLKPHHYLLDVGCGSLRGGVHFIRYLERGHYFGVDRDRELLEAGRELELGVKTFTQKHPTLVTMDNFDFQSLGRTFDFALAQSLFTHLPLNSILRCLTNMQRVLASDGRFYATFFENPADNQNLDPIVHEPGGTVSHLDRDPYHYDFRAFRWLCESTTLDVTYIGAWDHPRNQKLVVFTQAVEEDIVPDARAAEVISSETAAAASPVAVPDEGVVCPCCGWRGAEFRPGGVVRRRNAACPNCGSLERHRLMLLFLLNETPVFASPATILHFAAEHALARWFRGQSDIDYVTTDLADPTVSVRMDIADNLFRDGVFDCVICSHVLEHVPDDRAAMREIRRVLKPTGFALILVPILGTSDGRTFEDPSIVLPEERERAFGQHDHVRRYADDFPDRLREADFDVEPILYGQRLGARARRAFGLMNDTLFLCRPRDISRTWMP